MRKLFLSLSLVTILFGSGISNKANAALLISQGGTISGGEPLFPYALAGFGLTIAGGIITIAADANPAFYFVPFLVMMDAQGDLSQDDLITNINEKYPEINNEQVVKELAMMIRHKYQICKNPVIHLSEQEIRNILSPLELDEEVILNIINELK